MNETIPNLMGEPMAGAGGFAPVADPGMFGQTAIQPMSQQQEVLAPAPVQQQGMLVPSQPQGPRTAVPQLVGLQLAFLCPSLFLLCTFLGLDT